MKKAVLAIGLAAALLVPTQRAQAIIGLGLHAGQDRYTVPGNVYSNLFGIPGISLEREDFESPIGIGGYLLIDFIPIIDLELGFDLYGQRYNFTYTNSITGDSEPQDFAWVRTAGYFSIQKPIIKLPMLKLYVGGGLNFNASLPIVDRDFIMEFLENENTTLDLDALLDASASNQGLHIEVGLRFKPLFIPFAINVKFRRTFVEGIIPGEDAFSTISAGIGFQI